MSGAKKLLAWRLANDLSQREAAERAGLTKAAWRLYESGTSPKASAIEAIQRLTGGAVALTDWIESEKEKAERRAKFAAKRVRVGRPAVKKVLPRRGKAAA